MLPYFFRHYENLIDHFYFYDNGSVDGTIRYLSLHPRTTIRSFVTDSESFGLTEIRLSNRIWRDSVGVADWVVVVDIDEHIFHADLRAYLTQCRHAGVTALRSIGYDMVADVFPPPDVTLTEHVTLGARSLGYDKFCIFDPASITETGFGPGRHTASPTGHVVWPRVDVLRMLHYKKLGAAYVIARHQELSRGLGRHDRLAGYGDHYLWSPDRTRRDVEALRARARPVPGLGGDEGAEASEAAIERLVAETGLVDRSYYLEHYPDVARARIDPVRHFCLHGWREGRKPNPYFDTAWYSVQHDCPGNPLLHYILQGEAAGALPSPSFDPMQYRQIHGLSQDQSALRHCLTVQALRSDISA